MGRGIKKVLNVENNDRRQSGYYSTPQFVAEFISRELLRIKPDGKRALDPCAGKEELQGLLHDHNVVIDSFDIEHFEIKHRSNFNQLDFLKFYASEKGRCILNAGINLDYDFIIANPPYNCHEVDYIRNNKGDLLNLFPEIGVHNMYSMFISAMIDCAKEGALIGLITLDSFLTARAHHELRKQIFNQCAIHLIALCPTDLFRNQKADVRTCIVILQKGKKYQKEVLTANRPRNILEFKTILAGRIFDSRKLSEIILQNEQDLNEFVIGCPSEILNLLSQARLGQIFKCVTGISTGNDKEYISPNKKDGFSVPFYKNPGTNRFFANPNGFLNDNFLEIEKVVSNFQVRNKDVLFHEGITCSSMGIPFSAAYLPPHSTFGVNPNIICAREDIWWLIGYLNSSLVTYFVRGILLRTNMITSGYVSRIPIVNLSKITIQKIAEVSYREYERKSNCESSAIKEIDKLIFEDIGISNDSKNHISLFCSDLLRFV